jgi:Glyoxalase/Bleomycin resistance protein/Dioxygenase superfamily
MTLRAADQFHMGIVVDDFESTLAELSDLFGYTWCAEVSHPIDVRYPDGATDVGRVSFVYSTTTPRLEIIRAVPDTVWMPSGAGVHHLGYWSDDVEADSARLSRRGFAEEITGIRPDGEPFWAYLRHTSGLRIELVSRVLQPSMEEYFASGEVPASFGAPQ